MAAVIRTVKEDSPAKGKIFSGETLVSINGRRIRDVLDYMYYAYDRSLTVALKTCEGRDKLVQVQKEPGADMGLEFESYLMDSARSCANKCVFCFIDQLPPGMRETLYFKDDDARLSFLTGNYITMTNLSDREVERIIRLKISPINVSVHTTDPELRVRMLGNRNAGRCFAIMQKLAAAQIEMNCQIVCCPGLNDGPALRRTMADLASLYPSVHSVSIVPVGLTKYRDGLASLVPFNRERAEAVIDDIEDFGTKYLMESGGRIFYPSDELYIRAERELPDYDFYEGFPQLENGVGMLRLFTEEFYDAAEGFDSLPDPVPFSVATGVSAAPYLEKLLETTRGKCDNMGGQVYAIVNCFFGPSIDVAGLLTGGDIRDALIGKPLGRRLLIPQNMLRSGEDVFLDDMTLSDLSAALGVPVIPIPQDGGDFFKTVFEPE